MKTRPTSPHFALILLLVGSATAVAADWPHLMGPGFDRKTAEVVPAPWAKGQPRKVWEIAAHGGFSSFVTGGGRAYTVLLIDGRETVVAVDRKTGKTVWQTPLGVADYRDGGDQGTAGNSGGDGPRATPVFAAGRLFVFGGQFDLHALDSATGKGLWKRELIREFGGSEIEWSNAASPLVAGDRVLVSGGGRGQADLAFRADNGEVLWKTGSDRPTHASPILANIHGQEQALFMAQRGLVARDPTNGRELWHYPFPYRTATAASPVVWEDIVNCSAVYGIGGAAVRVRRNGDKWDVDELWRSPGDRETAAHWGTAVVHEGYLYGCYGRGRESHGTGPFKCIDIRTGKVMWQKPGFGPGQVIMAGNRLVATTDAGVLTLIEPTPSGYRELASAKLIEGKVWATPAFSDGQLLLRSTKQGVCLEF
ncbi:MAG: alcohol dehydrogenase [Opitutus sp.]|nr:alcohol dehydrogenase [Opitutus sp.]